MFHYFDTDITVRTSLNHADLAKALSTVLSIPPLRIDDTGRFEGERVYVSECFGLDFELFKDEPPLTSYHLVVHSDVDAVDFDGTEQEVDGTQYVLHLLKRGGIDAAPRDPKLLYPD